MDWIWETKECASQEWMDARNACYNQALPWEGAQGWWNYEYNQWADSKENEWYCNFYEDNWKLLALKTKRDNLVLKRQAQLLKASIRLDEDEVGAIVQPAIEQEMKEQEFAERVFNDIMNAVAPYEQEA